MGWMTGVQLLSKGNFSFVTKSKLTWQFHRASYPVVSARGKSPWYETNHLTPSAKDKHAWRSDSTNITLGEWN